MVTENGRNIDTLSCNYKIAAEKKSNSKMLSHHLEEVHLSYSGDTVPLNRRQKI